MSIGRPLQFDPDQALGSAMQLFWRKGYESTSLHDLLKVTGLSKSSFYQTFGSKHAVFERSINRYKGDMIRELRDMLDQSVSGKAFIEQLFESVTTETRGKNSRRGCLVMNTASEFAQTDPVISKLIKQSTKAFCRVFEDAILRAQQEGEVNKNRDSKVLATYLLSSMSGLKTQVKAGISVDEVRAITGVILSVLD